MSTALVPCPLDRCHLANWHSSDRPTSLDEIEGRHIEAFIADQIDRLSASTAATRFRCLRVFFNWAEDEQENTANRQVSVVAATNAVPTERSQADVPGAPGAPGAPG